MVIDIHQHTHFHGRSDQELIAHQRKMGVDKTVLLPSGSQVKLASTNDGYSNGLGCQCTGNEAVYALVQQYPDELAFFACEVPDKPDARQTIEKYLNMGAIGIGELKFNLEVDSKPMRLMYDIARDYDVPVLMHFQHGMFYSLDEDRMRNMLEAYPTVNFIGHAQTWWGNIDKHHDQDVRHPKGLVTAGGITDRLMSDYPNMYGDHSAGSGLTAMTRDEGHTTGFLERHQDQLLFGTDCADAAGYGDACQGSQTLATLRRLAPTEEILRKILYLNARKLFKMGDA